MFRTLLARLLNNPELAGGRITGWRLGWAGSWSGFGLGLALLAAVGVSLWLYRGSRRVAGRRWHAVLVALRVLTFAMLLLLLCQPVLYVSKTGVVKGACIILVDRTRSMDIVDRLGHEEMVTALKALGAIPVTAPADVPLSDAQRHRLAGLDRFAVVKGAVARQADAFLKPLDERFRVEVFTFGSRLVAPARRSAGAGEGAEQGKQPAPDLARLIAALPEPDGDTTRIGAAIRGALERLRGQPIAGIIIFTDGANNAGEDPRVVATYAARLGLPIYPVGVGAARARDLQLAAILGDDVVFKDDVRPITVRLRSTGYTGRRVTLVLSTGQGESEKVLKVKPDVLITGDGEQTEEIEFLPQTVGRTRINVAVRSLPDEQNPANNARSKTVSVTDRKMRVLYVENRPRWEYRALRIAMNRDRRVEPTYLLQEADHETATRDEADTGPRSLRAFPESRRDLFDYDVIVFGNVDAESLTTSQLGMVVEFVEMGGGGFVLIAGEDRPSGTIGPRALAATRLGAMLPVSLQGTGFRAAGARDGRFGTLGRETDRSFTEGYRPRLTSVGRTHAVTRLAPTLSESERLWRGLPAFYWYYPDVARVRPAAQVLLEHPTARNRLGSVPLVVVHPFGRGKAMFIGFDEVWRWRDERRADYFYRFYGQVLQYLGLSHLLGQSRRVQITLSKGEVGVGEPLTVFARVLDESFKPAVVDRITAVVRRSPGGKSGDSMRNVRGPARFANRYAVPRFSAREVGGVTLVAAEGAPGTYRGQFVPTEPGEYEVAIDDPSLAAPNGNGDGEGSLATFSAVSPRLELADPSRDAGLLAALADLSGGTAVELDQLGRLPDLIEQRRRAEPVRLELPLWDSWLALALAAAVPCIEWLIRKRIRLA